MRKDRKSLELTGDQWQKLDQLAYVTGSVARGGPSTGQPSWRVLVRRLAEDGEIVIEATGAVLVIRLNSSN